MEGRDRGRDQGGGCKAPQHDDGDSDATEEEEFKDGRVGGDRKCREVEGQTNKAGTVKWEKWESVRGSNMSEGSQ